MGADCVRCGELEKELEALAPFGRWDGRPQTWFLPTPRTAVVIESPFGGDLAGNAQYLDACIADALERGETPYASHRMLTRTLDDRNQLARESGIEAGRVMARILGRAAFYVDRGWSPGMLETRTWFDQEAPEVEVMVRKLTKRVR